MSVVLVGFLRFIIFLSLSLSLPLSLSPPKDRDERDLCPFGGACAGNHVLAWGGVPRQGCVCCHATSLPSLSLSFSSVLSGVRALVTTSLPGVVSHGRGACVATPRPFLLSLSLFRSLYLSHLCPFGGACAGNPRPCLGWCPTAGVRVLPRHVPSLSLSSLSFRGVRALVTTSLPGVVSHGRGACVATPRPFLLSLSLSLSLCMF